MNRLDSVERRNCEITSRIFSQATPCACTRASRNPRPKSGCRHLKVSALPAKHGGARETITVRKTSFGVGVERIFPLHATIVDHIDVVKRGHVPSRQALLPAQPARVKLRAFASAIRGRLRMPRGAAAAAGGRRQPATARSSDM